MTHKYFTTPIYYVNGKPHIGTAYCTLATDLIARYWRTKLGNENVLFLTGTDENSQKTIEAAATANKDVDVYLKEMADDFQNAFTQINISFDDFIRTTEDRHQVTVQKIAQMIFEKGDIYKGTYKGKYCTGCEAFYKAEDLTEEGHCPTHLKPVKDIEEANYFFRLSKYQDQLLEFYEQNPDWLQPTKRKNEVLSFIKSGLEDVSISREGAEIGIPIPWDTEHKMYVWFEAVINYYTAIDTAERKKIWPEAVHIIGKDITRFHCVMWPAMLMSAGLPLPKAVFAHGFFTVNGHKMSKSLDNVVDPLELAAEFGNDALRMGLLSSFEFGNDGDFSADNFAEFYRSKLAGGVGNLFNRVVVLIQKFLDGDKSELSSNAKNKNFSEFELKTLEKNKKIGSAIEHYKIKEAIDTYFEIIGLANERLNQTEVWKLAKTDKPAATKIFAELLFALEQLTIGAKFLLPESYDKMQTMLGDNTTIGEKMQLFPQK
jgi:methionyl-tRNA synthetase